MVDQSPLLPKSQSPLLPDSQVRVSATRPQQFRAYMTSIATLGTCALPILTVAPYFNGHTCKAIPSAFGVAIFLTVLGLLSAPGKLYNMYKRVKAGELPSGVIELSGKREDGTLCELYKGQLLLLKFDQGLLYFQMALGTFYLFPLAMMNKQYLHDPDPDNMEHPEEHCNHTIFTMILVFGCIFFALTCIAVLVLLAVAIELIKKPPANPKTPGIADFSGAL